MSHKSAASRFATYATALAVVAAGLLAFAGSASANTFTATDTPSFISAVNSANSTSGANTIIVKGGIYGPTSTVTFTNTTGPLTIVNQSDNQPPAKFDGGAVQPFPSPLFVINHGVTVNFDNIEVTTGGGSGAPAIDSNGVANFDRSLIAGNNGNGLVIEPGAGNSSTITNSTFSDGLAAGIVDGGTATLTNTTVAFNQTLGIDNSSGVLNLVNTIVAKNGPTTAEADCAAPATTADHSLDGDNTCGVGALGGKNPLLGGLVQQGGSHPVHTLQAGSPASDAGDSAKCLTVDERDAPRPDDAGTACDIGAVEAGVTLSPTKTTLSTSGSPSAVGAPVTFTAKVSSLWFPTETGTVQFMDGSTALGAPVTLTSGTASLTTSTLASGTHSITAVYSGDSKDATSTSSPVSQFVAFAITASGATPNSGVESSLLNSATPVSGTVATFSNGDPNATASQFTATISWGDGSTSAGSIAKSGSGFTVSGSHTYTEDGNYPVKVSIGGPAGTSATATTTAHVAEPSNAVGALLDTTVEPLPVVGPLF